MIKLKPCIYDKVQSDGADPFWVCKEVRIPFKDHVLWVEVVYSDVEEPLEKMFLHTIVFEIELDMEFPI